MGGEGGGIRKFIPISASFIVVIFLEVSFLHLVSFLALVVEADWTGKRLEHLQNIPDWKRLDSATEVACASRHSGAQLGLP